MSPFHLTPAQKTQFEEEGLLVIPSFFSQETSTGLLNRSQELLSDFSLDGHPLTIFGTDAEKGHVGDEYFLTSGNKIRFFFEPSAFNSSGELNRPKELAVNKIGHGLHDLDPLFNEFTFSEDVRTLAKELEFHKDPRVIQSMVICKQKEVGGAVNIHDDSTFLYTTPLSALGFWFALEKCTHSNGCLSFVPGSHKVNKINKRLVRVEGGGTEIRKLEGADEVEEKDWEREDWKSAECEAGDLVLIHGSVIHRSEKNLSQKSRFIYTFHMIEGSAEWDEKNWLQPTDEKPFSKLFG